MYRDRQRSYILVVCILRVSGQFWSKKNHARKTSNIHKILIYTKSSSIIFYPKISRYSPLYILLTRRIDTFWSESIYTKMFQYFYYTHCLQEGSTYFDLKVSEKFCLEVPAQFWPKYHTRKTQNIHRDF